MNVIECAEQLRNSGFSVYTWRPSEGTVEPDIIARKNGQLYNVYLSRDAFLESAINAFAIAHDARVVYVI